MHNALLAQMVGTLATLLPFSPGGAGTKQGLLVYVLTGQAPPRGCSPSAWDEHRRPVFNVAVAAIALYVMVRTLRLGQIIGRAKAARKSEQTP